MSNAPKVLHRYGDYPLFFGFVTDQKVPLRAQRNRNKT